MRKVIVGAMASMDGVMQSPGGPEEDPTDGFKFGGWVAPLGDPVFGEEIGRMLGPPYDLLLGRRTCDIFAACAAAAPALRFDSLEAVVASGALVSREKQPAANDATGRS